MDKLKFIKNFKATDLLVIFFSSFLILLCLIFHQRIYCWDSLVAINILLIVFVSTLSFYDYLKQNKITHQLRFWYLVPMIFLVFKEMYYIVDPLRQTLYDDVLIKIDRFLFGADPTIVLYKIANPYLTELLQIVYGTFFFLPIILGLNLLCNGRKKEIDYMAFIIVLGFFLSYIGYIIVPAIGPRFTLHDFHSTSQELPGLFLTEFLREVVNTGESIPSGTVNPAQVVQRDVFPSGHTQMTLLVMYLSVKFNTKSKYFFLVNGSLLIFATVYLRYHYVIDLIAGAVFMVLTLRLGKYLYNKWMEVKGDEKFYL